MPENADPDSTMKLVTEIVVAYIAKSTIDASELPKLVQDLRAALVGEAPATPHAAAGEIPLPIARPRISVEESITPEFLISFEDGKPYRSLKRHLMVRYGMTPETYRTKWGLPADYHMVAPAYAEARSQVARRSGLGNRDLATSAKSRATKDG